MGYADTWHGHMTDDEYEELVARSAAQRAYLAGWDVSDYGASLYWCEACGDSIVSGDPESDGWTLDAADSVWACTDGECRARLTQYAQDAQDADTQDADTQDADTHGWGDQ